MKIKKSDLQIIEFNLLGINILSHLEIKKKTSDKFKIDFDVFIDNIDESQFKIMIRLSNIKNDDNQGGYGIDVSGEFKFKFKNNIDIPEDRKSQLVSRSALPMAIAHIRSIIALTTSNFYKGSYFLPSIDLNSLLQKKLKSLDLKE